MGLSQFPPQENQCPHGLRSSNLLPGVLIEVVVVVLKEGDEAPNFSLPDKAGNLHSLSDFAGKTVVLYFYPEDDTPGCTTEACEFRDAQEEIIKRGAVIIGVSPDSGESHLRFEEKYGLNFLLLSDPSHKVLEAYGSWGRKKFAGREYDGVFRNTFVIGPDGRVRKIFLGVTPKGHARQVLDSL